MGANLFMLGLAFQRGLIPLQLGSLMQAIELNAVAVPMNKAAFNGGRRAAVDLAAVTRQASPQQVISVHKPRTLAALVATRAAFLSDYQNAAYAEKYRARVARIAEAESAKAPGKSGLAEAVALRRVHVDVGLHGELAVDLEDAVDDLDHALDQPQRPRSRGR